MDPFLLEFWVRVGLTVLCGGLIGLERQLRGKPAGIRTSMLVCLGTYVFTALGMSLQGPDADPTRVLAQVVTGVGFLGAGVILTQRGQVKGMTSAAVIWMLASIGATIGVSSAQAAAALTFVTLGILSGVTLLESMSGKLRLGVHADDPDERNGANGASREPPR